MEINMMLALVLLVATPAFSSDGRPSAGS